MHFISAWLDDPAQGALEEANTACTAEANTIPAPKLAQLSLQSYTCHSILSSNLFGRSDGFEQSLDDPIFVVSDRVCADTNELI